MIVVSVELWSAVSGHRTQLGRMHISNDGKASIENPRLGDYVGETFVGRDAVALAKLRIGKTGRVHGWRRHDWHVWNLVRRMLEAMGYDKGPAGPPVSGGKPAKNRSATREDLARIIDPEAWAYHDACPVAGGGPWTASSLAKADQILALQGGAGA